jgi:hypothetical protein
MMNSKKPFSLFLALVLWLVPAGLQAAEAPSHHPGFKPYPLDFCLVGGEKLGAMGKPIALKYEGREIKFCCKGCIDGFKKDHEKFMAKLAEADKSPSASGAPKPADHKPSEHKH